MSFPTIPDITPEITINREEAINLLLASIALEEVSLSDLIDAEAKKVCHMVNHQDDRHTIEDIKDINRSVNQTIKDIVKLQMLLQFKLENVQEMIGPCKTSTSTSTTTATTTTTTTTTLTTTTTKSTTSTKTTTTAREKCKCCLEGEACGCVTEKCDFFFGGTATIKAGVCKNRCHTKENLLQYHIRKDTVTESVKAFPGSLETTCLSTKVSNEIKIKGKCSIVRKAGSQNAILDMGSFELIVWDTFWTKQFRMVILADKKSSLDHDSGKVAIPFSGLSIEI